MSILIKKGHVIDPANKRDGVFDILAKDGKVSKIGKDLKDKAELVIDGKGKIVTPGLVDMHTHLREPGREDRETIKTGLAAAVKGGFTSVASMPNTTPCCDNQSVVRFIIEEGKSANLANVFPIGAITKGREGKELSEMWDLKEAGSLAFSDDGGSVKDSFLMRRALEYASMFDTPIISHCEDAALSEGGVMHEGFVSTVLGLGPIPSRAESTIVARDIELAEIAGAKIHIAHVSAKESVDIIKKAKEKGIKVTAEVTPHHLALTDVCVKTFDTNTKVNPPLRGAADREALKKALKDNTIDVIATDHAPHLESEKDVEFDNAPFGIIGLETALSICIMELIDKKVLSWPELVRKLSLNPSQILGIERGTLSEGASADVTIIDPDKEWIYKKEDIKSKSTNSPFIGWTLKGLATHVIVGGRLVSQCS
jgi:dihydroorotase